MRDLGSAPVPEPDELDHVRGPDGVPLVIESGGRDAAPLIIESGGRDAAPLIIESGGPDAAPLVIEYADFECPFCAALSARLARRAVRRVFRHFPIKSAHPRAWPTACAAEAAGRQGRFWEMHDLLFADPGRLEDPHLWERASRLGLDLDRFEADRRSEAVRERVQRDFLSGVRAGVVSTPSLFCGGRVISGRIDDGALDGLLGGGA